MMVGVALPIEDYAVIGDTHTAAIVGRDGSIDWLCLPRFDSAACFASLVGDESNGFWRIAPRELRPGRQSYQDDTLILETEYTTKTGRVRVIDFMPVNAGVREQFGRTIASFQAIKHKCARLFVRSEMIAAAAWRAFASGTAEQAPRGTRHLWPCSVYWQR